MQNEKNKRTALYARTSSRDQFKGLESQVRVLREYCHRNEVDNYLLYSDDGISGVKNTRPALDRMMQDCREGKISRVVCYSFSRYARSTTHLLRALEEFKGMGIKFVSLSEDINTDSPLGKALFTILASLAQLERDILIERVKCGLANAKAKGVHIGRRKTRPSALLRKLHLSGLTYRAISKICGVSSGAIGAEVRSLREDLKTKSMKEIQEEIERELNSEKYKHEREKIKKLEEEKAKRNENSPHDDKFSKPIEVMAA